MMPLVDLYILTKGKFEIPNKCGIIFKKIWKGRVPIWNLPNAAHIIAHMYCSTVQPCVRKSFAYNIWNHLHGLKRSDEVVFNLKSFHPPRKSVCIGEHCHSQVATMCGIPREKTHLFLHFNFDFCSHKPARPKNKQFQWESKNAEN